MYLIYTYNCIYICIIAYIHIQTYIYIYYMHVMSIYCIYIYIYTYLYIYIYMCVICVYIYINYIIILYYIILYSIIHKEYVARFHPFRDGSITLVPWWLRVSCGYRLDSPTSGVLPVILAEDGSNVAKCFQARWRLAQWGLEDEKPRFQWWENAMRTYNIWQELIKQIFFEIVWDDLEERDLKNLDACS